MLDKMKDISTMVFLVLVMVILVYFAASCAPANYDPSVVSNNVDAYVGKYVDMEYNHVCYFTRSSPYQIVCFDINR